MERRTLILSVIAISILAVIGGYNIFFRPSSYSISASDSVGGSIEPSGEIVVTEGSEKSFTITSESGYHILDVLVDGDSVGPVSTYDFTNVMTTHTIEASFEADVVTWTITTSASTGGRITPIGNIDVTEGESQSFTIEADAGYHISDVLVDGVSIGVLSDYDFNAVNGDHELHASFIKDTTIPSSLSHLWSIPGEVYDVEVSGNGEYFFASAGYLAEYYSIEEPESRWSVVGVESIYWDVAISTNGDQAVVSDETGLVHYFTDASSRSGYQSSTWRSQDLGDGIRRNRMDLSDDGEVLIVAGDDGYVYSYLDCSDKNGKNIAADWFIETGSKNIVSLDVSSDGKYAIVAGLVNSNEIDYIQVSFLDVQNKELVWSYLSTYTGTVYDVAVSDNGYSASAAIYNLDTDKNGIIYWADASGATSSIGIGLDTGGSNAAVAFSGDGDTLVFGSESLSLWSDAKMLSGESSSASWSIPLKVDALEVTKDGNLVFATVSNTMGLSLQVIDNQGTIIGFEELLTEGLTLSTSDDGTIIVLGDNDNNIYVYSLN